MKTAVKRILTAVLTGLALVGLDQYTKYLAVFYLKGQQDCILIPEVFRLTYVENFGAAFGTMQNSTVFLLLMTGILMIYLFLVYGRLVCREGYRCLRIICLVIIAGGIGNIIDRVMYGFVVDFLYFELIDFPVFNVADCYITCGVAALLISMFTIYKEDDMELLIPFAVKKNPNKKEGV